MDKLFNAPLKASIEDLQKAIVEYKKTFPGYITPEYERLYLNNFKAYLTELERNSKETALIFIDHGIKFAKALNDSVENEESAALVFSLYSKAKNQIQVDEVESSVIRHAILTKDPSRFGHDPGVDSTFNKNARKNWYEFVQLNKHQIAKMYVTRSQRNFSKDEVMYKYHLEREKKEGKKKKLGVEKAHHNTLEWLKSYGKSIDQVYEEIGIQVHDKDSFNKEYTRWKKRLGTELS